MIKIGKYNFCILDLIFDKDGKLSSTAIWYHIANIIESYRILTNPNITEIEILVYLVIVGGSKVAMQIAKLRYGGTNVKHVIDDMEK